MTDDSQLSQMPQTDDTQAQPTSLPDPAVDQVVQQGLDLNTTLAQESADQATPTDQPKAQAGKSPLDLLEEILEKEKGSDPAVPTKSSEELAQEAKLRQEQQQAEIEAHRQKLQQEMQTPEQQKRDDVRKQQAQDLQPKDASHIPQLGHAKIWIEEK